MSRRKNTTIAPPRRRRPTNHRHELEAIIVWQPFKAYSDDYVLPDWVAGAD